MRLGEWAVARAAMHAGRSRSGARAGLSGRSDRDLCWLHEDDDDHWVAEADIVGLIPLVDGELRRDMPLAQAARSCAEALGQPERIVERGTGR